MTYIAFILSSVVIIAIVGYAISNSLSTIKILDKGSTLEKMQVLGIGTSHTMIPKLIKQKVKRHRIAEYVCVGCGCVLVFAIIVMTIYRLLQNVWGL